MAANNQQLFNQLLVTEYRALAALYHQSLLRYQRWVNVDTFLREAPSRMEEFECDVMLDSVSLAQLIASRGSSDLLNFLNTIVDRHNAIMLSVYDELPCGIPYEMFHRLTRLTPLTPNIVSRALFFHRNRNAQTIVWFNDEILDIGADYMMFSDKELGLRLSLLSGTTVVVQPCDEMLEAAYKEYMEHVFVGPEQLVTYKRVYALHDSSGHIGPAMQEYIRVSALNGVTITELTRNDVHLCREGDFVLSDDHAFIRRACTFKPSVDFGGLTPLSAEDHAHWTKRRFPNLFIVPRYPKTE